MDAFRRPKFTRRRGIAHDPSVPVPSVDAEGDGSSRRAFLRSSGGYAAGAATLVGVPAAVLPDSEADAAVVAPKRIANPKTPVPDGPVMAYVHDAKKGTVVIMSGTTERTVQDPALVAKLLHAPAKKKPKRKRSVKPKATKKVA